ncbi:PLP-dependent aminotransferase family protein [Caballeronia mineralivorans]|uniref:MocR-like pyridoxine biosynthesis transcription factor PdxR n=1 Tax=Caballeronia mineralivorans TaxID=2010198 RepID=UPI0023F14F47|nr:PLP-dependent aminotransferase family protein [Caballeronia mineralivorans]
MRELIHSGSLPPGSAMPSSRELSRQLHTSRNTVSEAYDLLLTEGYLSARSKVGTFVSTVLPESTTELGLPPEAESWSGPRPRSVNLPLPYASRGTTGLHRVVGSSLQVDFSPNQTDWRLFPDKVWRRLIMECLGGGAARISQYNDPAGLPELRQLITSMLGPKRAMNVSPEQLVMVAGCQQGMALAAHLLIGARTPVVVEAPCYRGATFLFESYGGRIIPVPVDEHGIDVDRLPSGNVKVVYVTPSHQFPTGATMSLERRIALLDWAAQVGAYVLEVDWAADFRYEDSPLPSLWSLDRNRCVIYISSFSRSLAPGLRIGYAVFPRDLIVPATRAKGLLDNGMPWLEQAALAQFIRDGSWDHHLRRLRQASKSRRDTLVAALLRQFPGAVVSGFEAGMHLVCRLPPQYPGADTVQALARAAGVGVYPLRDSPAHHFETTPEADRVLLLGYTHLDEGEIRQGVELLASALNGGRTCS